MTDITFDTLPQAVLHLFQKVESIELLLRSRSNETPPETSDRWFDIKELLEYLPDKPARATIYGKVHFNTIPYHKTAGQKKLRFLKSEIDAWLLEGRRKTVQETAAEAQSYISRNKR